MTSSVRIGIIGCGRILPAHLRGYRLLREAGVDDFRITGLVARNLEDARMFRKRGEGLPPREPVSHNPSDALAAPHCYVSDFQSEELPEVYPSVEALLAADSVDAVDITATLPVHHTAGLMCLEAGKHAMIEKPLAVTVRAARRLVDTAEQRSLTLAVAETIRYSASARLAKWLIERGAIGRPQMALSVSIGTPEWSPDIVVADTPWRHQRLVAGGGAAIDMGVHLAHRLRYLVGEIETLTAVARTFEPQRHFQSSNPDRSGIAADVDDAFFALPQFASGATGTLAFSWAGHGEPTGLPEGTAIYGGQGCLKGALLVRDDGTREEARAIFEREASQAERDQLFPLGLTDPFALGYLDWLRAIRAGTQPEASGYEGLRDLATAYAILESSEAGGPVKIADVLAGRIDAYQAPIDAHYEL